MALALGVVALLLFLSLGNTTARFWSFLLSFLLLFAATGIGDASTFQYPQLLVGQAEIRGSS